MQRNRNAAIDRLLHFIKVFKVSGRSFDSFDREDGDDFVEIRNRKVGRRTLYAAAMFPHMTGQSTVLIGTRSRSVMRAAVLTLQTTQRKNRRASRDPNEARTLPCHVLLYWQFISPFYPSIRLLFEGSMLHNVFDKDSIASGGVSDKYIGHLMRSSKDLNFRKSWIVINDYFSISSFHKISSPKPKSKTAIFNP